MSFYTATDNVTCVVEGGVIMIKGMVCNNCLYCYGLEPDDYLWKDKYKFREDLNYGEYWDEEFIEIKGDMYIEEGEERKYIKLYICPKCGSVISNYKGISNYSPREVKE